MSEYKKAGLVRTGLRRRVFAEIYQMLKKQEYHYDRDAHNHETKMSRYRLDIYHRRGVLVQFDMPRDYLLHQRFKAALFLSSFLIPQESPAAR
jgi:hypothetical protein